MQKTIKEWELIQELMECLEDFKTESQREFVQVLFDNLDPYSPFLDQQSEKQLKWLKVLHKVYVEGDFDAYENI